MLGCVANGGLLSAGWLAASAGLTFLICQHGETVNCYYCSPNLGEGLAQVELVNSNPEDEHL
jgi:hypothetical protein